MQAQTMAHPAPPPSTPVARCANAPAGRRDERTLACDLFFARSAAAGSASEAERLAVARSIVDFLSIDSGRALPVRPRSSGTLLLIVEGWASHAHLLADGARQITDILLPGDVLDPATSVYIDAEHDTRACGRVRVAVLRRDVVTGRQLPSLGSRWEYARDAELRRLRSRLASLGRCDARGRLAHFLAEMHERLRLVGLTDSGSFSCPLVQEQIADVVGLTPVHVNRVLQRLRREGLVILNKPYVIIPDLSRVHAVAGLHEAPGMVDSGRRK